MNGYLIPANAKKGTLIFNLFRPFDLGLLVGGVVFSLIALAVIPSSSIILVILALLPGCICGLLVFPVPNYHNVLCALLSIIRFYNEERNYKWKGWCFNERFNDGSKSRK